ncbi:MAG: hydantoinase B/oxoprolinase family protein [Thermoleophilia bacterium]|nr:hydantoinase B/oxoprolinase family protein [Thermoleophilia bacterium]
MSAGTRSTAAKSAAARNDTVLETTGIVWDGIARGYAPPDVLSISPRLRLQTAEEPEVDPITYEVIRNSLQNINLENGHTIQKLSISPITMINRDFQCAILTETGDVMFMGPYLMYLANTLGIMTKWVLENRSENPGIEDGDVFLNTDPYVGSSHQQDTGLTSPVFWDGELFCWVANSVHYSDVGGPAPGSFCLSSTNIWEDPPLFPPMKLVERGRVRTDMEQLYLRQSRVPSTVGMDLHAALAGLTVSRQRILTLLERYGAQTVKAVMKKTLDASERAFVEKLQMIPDGRWSERIYTEAAVPGDRGIYVSQVNIVKEGDRLYVDNEGTSPQTGAINNTYAAFVGAVLAPLTLMLAYDLGGVCGGVSRRVKFRPVPGTITCADYPAPVSSAGVCNMPMVVATATGATAKMVACADPPLCDKAIGIADVHAYGGWIFNGVDQHGRFFMAMHSGMAPGGVPASTSRDGIDTGGIYWVPGMEASNVEDNETSWPVLTLYRRQNHADAAGAGRYRSGVGAEEAWMLHGAGELDTQVYNNESFAKCQGLLGGNPGGRAFFRWKRNTDIAARIAAGDIPQSLDEVAGEEVPLSWKGRPIRLESDSVWTLNLPNFAGYGDPLDRDPALVGRDVSEGKTTVLEALEVYGVVAGQDGGVDEETTAAERAGIRKRRLGGGAAHAAARAGASGSSQAPDDRGRTRIVINENLSLARTGGGLVSGPGSSAGSAPVSSARYVCACGQDLASAEMDFKKGCTVRESPVDAIGRGYTSFDVEMMEKMCFREFFCPRCGARLATEVARVGDEYLWDIELRL